MKNLIKKIVINKQEFLFNEDSTIRVEGYDLYITEPNFDEITKSLECQFINKDISLPSEIEKIVQRCQGLKPCSKIYKDAGDKRYLHTYFD